MEALNMLPGGRGIATILTGYCALSASCRERPRPGAPAVRVIAALASVQLVAVVAARQLRQPLRRSAAGRRSRIATLVATSEARLPSITLRALLIRS